MSAEAIDGLCAKIIEQRDRIKALEAALRECVEVLKLVEHPNNIDLKYSHDIETLGDRIGYGALMTTASALWRQYLYRDGFPVGGEFVAGPCHATVVKTLEIARAALAPEQDK